MSAVGDFLATEGGQYILKGTTDYLLGTLSGNKGAGYGSGGNAGGGSAGGGGGTPPPAADNTLLYWIIGGIGGMLFLVVVFGRKLFR